MVVGVVCSCLSTVVSADPADISEGEIHTVKNCVTRKLNLRPRL
jgi:hypothetical protein